jgi:hypothetical protein
MNAHVANDLEAADLLALARLDDDGVSLGSDPAAEQGRQVIRLAGAGQVTANQAEMIVAVPGRAEHVCGRR